MPQLLWAGMILIFLTFVRNDMSSTLSPNHNSYWYGGLSASVLAHKWVNAEWLNFWKTAC